MLANIQELSIIEEEEHKSFIQPTKYGNVFLEASVYVDVEAEILKMKKVLEKAQLSIDFLQRRLRNEEFVAKAPKKLIEKSKQELQETIVIKENVKRRIEQLKSVL